MAAKHITYLYNRWIDNTITLEEVKELTKLLQIESEEELKELMTEGWESFQPDGKHYNDEKSAVLLNNVINSSACKQLATVQQNKVEEHTPTSNIDEYKSLRRNTVFKSTWLRYAAIAVLTAGAALYLFQNNTEKTGHSQTTESSVQQINQGGNKAILTLANGRQVLIDSSTTGQITEEEGVRITRLENGQIQYELQETGHTNSTSSKAISYNTISTPKRGQYQVVLVDGTKVWLNAASSISFPTVFDKDRPVTIEGEAYFEVAANKSKPFFVHFRGGVISVLGTSFNINTYDSATSVKTTLLEGSVKVNDLLLKPGQAAINNKIIATNPEQDIAWKSGIFDFNKVTLRTAMQQIANWYDVDIEYVNGIPDIIFWGKMNRNLDLSELLDFLERMGVQFSVEGRRIIIKNN